MLMESSQQVKQWYAMRATYGRNMVARRRLDEWGVESFVPMRYRVVRRGRTVRRELEPVIRDLIFVRTTAEGVRCIKSKIEYLHYITRPEAGRNVPIVVPEEQMAQFVAVAATCDEQLLYLDAEDIDFRAGERVRIQGGPFDGCEGRFMRVAGARNRRVVVAVEGVIAVAMVTTSTAQLERLD